MRSKPLGMVDPGYHTVRKLGTMLSGLRHAAALDFSVGCKLALSAAFVAPALGVLGAVAASLARRPSLG